MVRLKLLGFLVLAATLAACSKGNPDNPHTDGGVPITTDAGTDAGQPDACAKYSATQDSDQDGLPDGVEDANCNGVVDPGETNPHGIDSDCDGLVDGPSNASKGWKGEDLNADGKVDPGETDPSNADTDGDGLMDGVEDGVASDPDSSCTAYTGDQDPGTTSDATNPDSDGDGIDDGTEDSNHNGKTDPGETDPGQSDALPDGGTSVAQEACSTDRLRPVVFRGTNGGQLRLGLPGSFAEVTPITIGGSERGLMGYDATHQVAFVAFTEPDPNPDSDPTKPTYPTQDESSLRSTINNGTISNATTQTFKTWDGFLAIQAFYSQSGSGDLKTQANALANALLGSGAGVLSGSAGANGPFQLEAEYVRRPDSELAVVLALAPAGRFGSNEPTMFSVGDTAGGSGLAEFTDDTNTRCEVFTAAPAEVDFVFVVDDSGSMDGYQATLASAADEVAAKLDTAYLDWRIALVTTDYHISGQNNSGVIRGFTRTIDQFKSWLLTDSTCDGTSNTCSLPASHPACDPTGGVPHSTKNGTTNYCWVMGSTAVTGSGNEGSLGAARKALDDMSPRSATEEAHKIRQGAQVVVVLLGDADDQTTGYQSTAGCGQSPDDTCSVEDVQDFVDYFTGATDPGDTATQQFNEKVTVDGIVCPDDSYCGEYQGGGGTNGDARRNAKVITSTGGIRGDINTASSITATIDAIIDNAINAAGHVLSEPPIGASIKVVLQDVADAGFCPKANPSDTYYDLPRSRANGFDFDGLTQKLSFFGACVPKVPNVTQAAVSYRSWVQSDVCPSDCGGCPTGWICDPAQCVCQPGIN